MITTGTLLYGLSINILIIMDTTSLREALAKKEVELVKVYTEYNLCTYLPSHDLLTKEPGQPKIPIYQDAHMLV